jgi:hypothetical protein
MLASWKPTAGKAGSVYQSPALSSPDSAVSSADRKIADASLKCRYAECDTPTMRAVEEVMRLPVLLRSVVAGAVGAGVLGCVGGLVVGLLAYPPTALVAVFELGIPAAMVGGVLGLIAGSVVLGLRKLARKPR